VKPWGHTAVSCITGKERAPSPLAHAQAAGALAGAEAMLVETEKGGLFH